jgi:hypothetical protein
MSLSALTRQLLPQQRPPWALRAASAIDNALEPIADQFGVLDLRTAAVPPVLHDGTRTVSPPMNNPIISRRALDEAIRSFRKSAQLPPFVSVAITHATTTVLSLTVIKGPMQLLQRLLLRIFDCHRIFRAEPNLVDYGSTVEFARLCLAQEPSLLPDGPSLAFPLALPTHTRGAAP